MSRVLLIGAGGVAGVAAAKMCRNPEVFAELLIVVGAAVVTFLKGGDE